MVDPKGLLDIDDMESLILELKNTSSDFIEKHYNSNEILEMMGNLEDFAISSETVSEIDYGNIHDVDAEFGDAIYTLKEALIDRWDLALYEGHSDGLSGTMDWVSDVQDQVNGMQKAIDWLKKHKHDDDTGNPMRPF